MKEQDIDKLKIIMALFVSLDNQIQSIDNTRYRQLIKKYFNDLKNKSDRFIKERFKGYPSEQLEIHDECANDIADVIDMSVSIGLPLSNSLLNAAKNGDLISVDEKNEVVKNQLTYLQNFNQLKK